MKDEIIVEVIKVKVNLVKYLGQLMTLWNVLKITRNRL